MDTSKAEYDILMILIYTFCFSIVVGLIGVWAGKVDAQFVEGLITGGLLTLITNMFKDLSNKNGGSNEKTITSSVSVVSPDAGKSGQPNPAA